MKGELIPMQNLTDAAGCDLRTLRKRLQRLDRRLGGTLLVQLVGRGRVYVDRAVLEQHAPALLRERDEAPTEDPLTSGMRAVLHEVSRLRDEVRDMHGDVRTVCESLG